MSKWDVIDKKKIYYSDCRFLFSSTPFDHEYVFIPALQPNLSDLLQYSFMNKLEVKNE